MLYIGSRAPLDARLVTEAGIPFQAISTGKLRRYFSWQNFGDPFRVVVGFAQSLRILRQFQPDVVFGKGGFVTVPVIKAAKLLGIPVVLHESDATPGLANRLSASAATKIAVSFPPEMMQRLPSAKLVFTGNPLSRDIYAGKPSRAHKKYQLDSQAPLLIVVGGSKGAVALNQLVAAALQELLPETQIVHQVGEASAKDYQAIKKRLDATGRARYHAHGYIDNKDLFDLYAAADIIVSRAGAGLLGNAAATGKPTVLVPLPEEVSDHQLLNARYFEERGAAVILPQDQATGAELARTVLQLLHNPQRRAEMGRAARLLATPDAAEKVADLVWETGSGKPDA